MFKILKKLIEIQHERAKARKAMHIMVKQSWSIEFIVALLCKVRDFSKRNVYVVLTNKVGETIAIYADKIEAQGIINKEKDIDIREEGVTVESLIETAMIKQGVV